MDTPKPVNRLHPMLWIAALAVTALSAVGIAAITGLLPVAEGHRELHDDSRMAAAQAAAPAASVEPARASPPSARPAPAATTSEGRTAAATRSEARAPAAVPAAQSASAPAACGDCGVIESIRSVQAGAPASGVGVIAGGVIGGVLGNQVGKGSGRDLATIGGAVLGGIAGNQVEKKVRGTTAYEIAVRMDDGERALLRSAQLPSWREGERVRVRDGAIHPAPAGR